MTTAANLHWNIFGFESWPQKTSNMWRDVKFTLWTKYLGRVDSYAKRTIQNLVCRFMFFLIHFFWQIFHEDIFHWIFGQFLTSTSGGCFLFLPNGERVVGWLGREWIIVGWRSPQNYSLGNQYNVDPHIMSILLLFNTYQVTTGLGINTPLHYRLS